MRKHFTRKAATHLDTNNWRIRGKFGTDIDFPCLGRCAQSLYSSINKSCREWYGAAPETQSGMRWRQGEAGRIKYPSSKDGIAK